MAKQITIVGAGPVGLAAALFLHDRGQKVRVLEKRREPVTESKALAVNPRTLELLESTGITHQMLHLGLRIRQASLWREDGSLAGEIHFQEIPSDYPYMLALSQSVTERLLGEALAERGVGVERGLEVMACETIEGHARARLDNGKEIDSDYLLGADGAHSAVRESLGIPFEGSSLPEPWHLADVDLDTDLDPEHAHVIFREGGGFYFVVRVVTDRRLGDPQLWRVISSRADPLAQFPRGRALAAPVWESCFTVSHRIGRELSQGAVFLAGDAAHLHSPAGARGMNLGIEDAWVFAELLKEERLAEYGDLRRAVDRQVVNSVDNLSRLAMGEAATLRTLRDFLLPTALRSGLFRRVILRGLAGLDHNVA